MKKGVLSVVGFLLLLFGLLSIILSLTGLQLSLLAWIDNLGGLLSMVIKVIMIFGGVVLMYLDIGVQDEEDE